MTTPDKNLCGTVDQSGKGQLADALPYIRARILYPALGCPEVVCPSLTQENGTNWIHLLLLANASVMTPKDVAQHLRYVGWDHCQGRHTRHLPADPATCSFDAYSRPPTPSDPKPPELIQVQRIDDVAGEDSLVQHVVFARGFLRAGLAKFVRDFYKSPKLEDDRLPYLYQVAICDTAAAALAKGPAPGKLYHLFWINPPDKRAATAPSEEMRVLLDRFADRRKEWIDTGIIERDHFPFPPRAEYAHDLEQPHTDANRTEVLHPLFVVAASRDPLQIAQITDTHLCTRYTKLAEEVRGKASYAVTFFVNYNACFTELYDAAKAACDCVVLTGDIVDYGRGHDGVGPFGEMASYRLDRNWFLLASRLAHGARYATPVYTVLGNHDWRIHPYSPLNRFNPIADDLQLTREEVERTHGPNADALFYPPTSTDALSKAVSEILAIETALDSIKWYLLTINPFLDYTVRLPGGYTFLLLDWAKKEQNLGGHPDQPREQVQVGLPVAEASLTALQLKLVEWFLSQKDAAKVVGLHAGIVSPHGDWPDHQLAQGWLDPCPLCGGSGTRVHLTTTSGGFKNAPTDCECTRLMSQPVGKPTRRLVLAANRARLTETPVPDRVMPVKGTIKRHRDLLIELLAKARASLVLSGHSHRTTVFRVTARPDELIQGLPAGTALLLTAADYSSSRLRGARPLYVNTSSAGSTGRSRPHNRAPGELITKPCWAQIALASSGDVQSLAYRESGLVKLRDRKTDKNGWFLSPNEFV